MDLQEAKALDRVLRQLKDKQPINTGSEEVDTITEFSLEEEHDVYAKHYYHIKGWRIGALCEKLNISPINLLGVADRMYEDQFIQKSIDFQDKKTIGLTITIKGIYFIDNGGYEAEVIKEQEREEKESEIIEKQLKAADDNIGAAKKSAEAASDSAKYSKWLLLVTAINVGIVLFHTIYEEASESQEQESIRAVEAKLDLFQSRIDSLNAVLDDFPVISPDTTVEEQQIIAP